MDVEQLRELIRIFEEARVGELILEVDGEKLILRKSGVTAASCASPAEAQPLPGAPKPPATGMAVTGQAARRTNTHTITSPVVGVFYRAPSPGAAPFVSVGDRVSAGQVVCILECMKMMNHLESDVSGRVSEILVENAQPVEFGQPLFVIELDG